MNARRPGSLWPERDPECVMDGPESTLESFESYRHRSYFGALDGLRGVSILLVLLHHATLFPGNRLMETLRENGRYGVAFFFAISGFLICTLFLHEEEKIGRINLWKFYGRRTLRLLPLYYVVLLFQAILVFWFHQYSPDNQQLFRDKLCSYLFYYSNWLPTSTQGPFFCSWSLAVEEQFYLVFGLLLFFLNRRVLAGLILVALLTKVIVYQIFGAVDVGSDFCRVLFSYREPILLGVLLAFLLNGRKGYNFFARLLHSRWSVALVMALPVGWLSAHLMQHESFWDAQLLYLLMILVLAAVVIRRYTFGLDNPVLRHVGKVSYGMYLLHMFVISSVRKVPGLKSPFLFYAIVVASTVAIASLVYKFFEQPIIGFYKRKLSPLNQPDAQPGFVLEPVAKTAALPTSTAASPLIR
jgi:peptidoglycan/LPS O-acetylase OafA/YrhL